MPSTAADLLEELRQRAKQRPVPSSPTPTTTGQRAADAIAALVGSWPFIIVQSAMLLGWVAFNALSASRVDPYPFILLNLLLSTQAAYTAPVIMMSQNRQAEIDRERSIEDFEINRKAELEIETLHEKIDLLREQEIAALTASVERLTRMLEERTQR
ncbi:MAG: DUF1003 domain-containing protein [Hyphomonadaceae bacterium]|nr:DUF1003 domain-containing protein [Hyphomonadaceae bacterium]